MDGRLKAVHQKLIATKELHNFGTFHHYTTYLKQDLN